ncbi:MAG: lysophospholipase [Rhodoferax sp.]
MTHSTRHREGQLEGQGGLQIYWQAWEPATAAARSAATLVIAHGYGEHGGRYAELAQYLVARGSTVYAIDHRGHGRSLGRRGYIDRFDNALADLDQLVDLARSEQSGRPLILLGHSLGGLLTLKYAIELQHKVDAVVLSGPGVSLNAASALLKLTSRVLSVLAPRLGLLQLQPADMSRDVAEVAAYAADPLNFHGKVPARIGGEALGFLADLPARLRKVTLPLLALHGKADALAGVEGSEMVVRTVQSQDKTLLVYDGALHEIFHELAPERARVMADLAQWIAARSASVA